MRFAVLGLYNSGSTALAGMLHRLGANMGPPFWENSDDDSAVNYYESYDLSWHLRKWWNEPRIAECVSSRHRIEFLKRWVNLQQCAGQAPVGAKHPLLSLCGPDLVEAWGAETLFFWSWRPLRESVAGLQRRGWFPGHQLMGYADRLCPVPLGCRQARMGSRQVRSSMGCPGTGMLDRASPVRLPASGGSRVRQGSYRDVGVSGCGTLPGKE